MPTKRPRYMVTDTGPVAEMLDRAQRAWPEMTDRKALLVRLAETGSRELPPGAGARGGAVRGERPRALARGADAREAAVRRERQRAAMRRVAQLVERDALLSDEPWR